MANVTRSQLIKNKDNKVDEKVMGYLFRAHDISYAFGMSSKDEMNWLGTIEIAKMIQLEEHRKATK